MQIEELKKALKNKEQEIEVVGPLAKKIIRQQKIKKGSAYSGLALGAAALAAAPFTGGLSLYGLVATAAPTVAVWSATDIAIIVAIVGIIGLSFFALLKGYNVDVDFRNQKVIFRQK